VGLDKKMKNYIHDHVMIISNGHMSVDDRSSVSLIQARRKGSKSRLTSGPFLGGSVYFRACLRMSNDSVSSICSRPDIYMIRTPSAVAASCLFLSLSLGTEPTSDLTWMKFLERSVPTDGENAFSVCFTRNRVLGQSQSSL